MLAQLEQVKSWEPWRVALIVIGTGAIFVALHGLHGFETGGGCRVCKFLQGQS